MAANEQFILRVISVAVAGVILATILITWISIQTLQKNYLKTFRNANQIFTEQINTDMTEFYAETATVMQTVRESWAFRRYFGILDMSTPKASYTIYSMKRQIDAIQSNQLKQTIRIIAIGRNGRSFISGESSLSISQEEILNSTFTKSIQEANGKPVVQYVENGLSTIAKGKGAYVIGSSLTYSNSTVPYGYVYAVIPLDTMSGFDIRYTGAASELFFAGYTGNRISCSRYGFNWNKTTGIVAECEEENRENLLQWNNLLRCLFLSAAAALLYYESDRSRADSKRCPHFPECDFSQHVYLYWTDDSDVYSDQSFRAADLSVDSANVKNQGWTAGFNL